MSSERASLTSMHRPCAGHGSWPSWSAPLAIAASLLACRPIEEPTRDIPTWIAEPGPAVSGSTKHHDFTLRLPHGLRRSGPSSWDNAFKAPPLALIVGVTEDRFPADLEEAKRAAQGIDEAVVLRSQAAEGRISVAKGSADSKKLHVSVWQRVDEGRSTLRCEAFSVVATHALNYDPRAVVVWLDGLCGTLELQR